MRVLVFGDSIAYGAWDTEGGWVDRVKREMHKRTIESQGRKKMQVINLGIGSDTSTKILARMQSEIDARQSDSWPFVFVFAFGANDQRNLDSRAETSVEQFETNTKQIIAIAKQYTNQIIFVGAPPILKPVIHFKDHEYSDARIQQYEDCMRRIVVDVGLIFLPVRPVFEHIGLVDLFSYDGIHPNDAGHQLIAEIVLRNLLSQGS
jgi:lysophospholipase L1-like esterase